MVGDVPSLMLARGSDKVKWLLQVLIEKTALNFMVPQANLRVDILVFISLLSHPMQK